MFNSSGSYTGSDVLWTKKPTSGETCSAYKSALVPGSTFGEITPPVTSTGDKVFTPVPANQTDGSSTGWVVGVPLTGRNTGASTLQLLKVTKNADGTANITHTASAVPVISYSIPPNAPEKGNSNLIDTSDARNTQAVSAIDPRTAKVELWTQHTVTGGAGSMVRWYEIDPAAKSVAQTGKVSSTTSFVFNGAVSPDRKVSGTTKAFGSNMVLSFNRSSTSAPITIEMVSKRGTSSVSSPLVVKTSTGPDSGFDCINSSHTCRWGDYAAATPDPAASTSSNVGRVWLTSMYANGTGTNNSFTSTWGTWNWKAMP